MTTSSAMQNKKASGYCIFSTESMSSLFRNSFQSKQLKQFTDITIKAIPSIKRDAIKPVYKAIKSGTNQAFNSIDCAIALLEKKYKLDLQIASYSNIINDKQNNTFSEVQSAKSKVVKLVTNEDVAQLLRQLERAFNLDKGSLSHPQTRNTHLHPARSNSHSHSLSVTKSNGLTEIENATESAPSTPSTTLNRMSSLKALSESPKEVNLAQQTEKEQKKFIKQRSRSAVIHVTSNYRGVKRKSETRIIPHMNTKEYLQFLLEKAVTNKAWNDNDADRLCKCAVTMKCNWITVHSMWVKKCFDLLQTYTIKQYKHELKAHRKSQRRGSRKMVIAPKDFKHVKNEKQLKSTCKICVTIGYPLGQTSTISKVAETKQSVADGAQRVRLMVSAGKVILEDWYYILHEVKRVVAAANGCDVRIVFPDTKQITEDIKHEFNQKIMQGMASKVPNETFSGTGTGTESSDTDDDESSVSYCSSVGDTTAAMPLTNPVIIPLSKSEEVRNVDKKISKKLLRVSSNTKRGKKKNKKNTRRASTMTSIKYKAEEKKRSANSAKKNNKNRKTLMINQSITNSLNVETINAVAEKQKKQKQKQKQKQIKKKKRKKNTSNVKSVGDIEELKKGKKKKKNKKKQKGIEVRPLSSKSSKSKKKDVSNKQKNKAKEKEKEKENKNNNKKSAKRKGKNGDKRRAKSVGKLKTKRAI